MRLAILLAFISVNWGLNAQSPDSVEKKTTAKKFIVKNLAVPVALVGLGLYTKDQGSLMNRFDVRDWRNNHYPRFSHHADDVLQFVPIGLVYGLDLIKVKSKNDLLNRTLILAKSEVLMAIIVRSLKTSTHVLRPDRSNYHSFPSGHTAQAFVAATFMHKELGYKSVWFSIGAYTIASGVGAFRILNNKHWVSDVLAGAGFAVLSTNLAYATHRYKWGKRPNWVAVPTYSNGPGIYVSYRFRE